MIRENKHRLVCYFLRRRVHNRGSYNSAEDLRGGYSQMNELVSRHPTTASDVLRAERPELRKRVRSFAEAKWQRGISLIHPRVHAKR